ncbi:hypothetical protein D3C87_79170 [compost metagenome]
MEELEYCLKEWINSYLVSKELTSHLTFKKIGENFIKYDWESNDKIVIRIGGRPLFPSFYVKHTIYANVIQNYINFDLCVDLKEYPLLKELDKIISGYSRFINNHKRETSYEYSFQLITKNENDAKSLIKRLFEQ